MVRNIGPFLHAQEPLDPPDEMDYYMNNESAIEVNLFYEEAYQVMFALVSEREIRDRHDMDTTNLTTLINKISKQFHIAVSAVE